MKVLKNFLFKTRNHLIYAEEDWSPFTGVEDRKDVNVQITPHTFV